MRKLLVAIAAGVLASAADPSRVPVLVELFTSEGCSSCPPADKVLETLDPSAVVLSEHVDYWDSLGWRDPYSARANTFRQEAYARRLRTPGPYTPEMVIDGAVEFNGSDGRRALEEITRSARTPRIEVRLRRSGNGLRIETDAVPHSADVMLALADESGTSQISGGENKGRRLHHVAILRSMHKVATVKTGASVEQTVALGPGTEHERVIVFLQVSNFGRISGVGMLVPQTVSGSR